MVRERMRRWCAGAGLLGALLLALGAVLLGSPSPAAQAQTLPPRPTAQPTAAPRGGGEGDTATGRITGTVIDLTTGAPAAQIAVDVGDVRVLTDANGNYDRSGLPAGSYTVALALPEAQGTAAQGPLVVTLAGGQTVVQHLAFRSPAATAVPTSLPTNVPQPQPTPARLPNTGAAGQLAGWPALLGALLLALGAALLSQRRRA